MSHFVSNQPSPLFSSGQIVALDHCNGILYGEIIQTVPQRQMCWIRGIALYLKTKEFLVSFGQDDAEDSLTVGNGQVSRPSPTTVLSNLLQMSALNQDDENNLEIFDDSTTVLVDLYRNVDLLFPLDLFRVAFDTEIMPILSQIDPDPHSGSHNTKFSRQCLNWFLKEIWQTNQDKFQV
ncbi:MAG: hypothetical protein QNJ60_03530 [Xenococcaceae cyanobacterium MO_188.B19]|nr:hypothetical protein [Xenococcaceae cyanobacterium MO_188.B19]